MPRFVIRCFSAACASAVAGAAGAAELAAGACDAGCCWHAATARVATAMPRLRHAAFMIVLIIANRLPRPIAQVFCGYCSVPRGGAVPTAPGLLVLAERTC